MNVSHASFSVSPMRKAISSIPSMQRRGLPDVGHFSKNCELRGLESMCYDYSRSNGILDHHSRKRDGLCSDFGSCQHC